jgi:hypothetical protein
MPFERRIRDGLDHTADSVDTDVERSLQRVLNGRRRPAFGRTAAPVAVLLAVILMLGIPALLRLSTGDTADGGALAGRYEVTLQAPDVRADPQMAGRWQLRLLDDGAVVLTPPDPFVTRAGGTTGTPCTPSSSACRYDADDTTLHTNLQPGSPGVDCNSIGAYTWQHRGDRLTLHVVADTCPTRRALLTARSWTSVGG